jgi:hypothetical protein
MKFNLLTIAKAYLLLVSLINFNHVISMLGLTETLVNAPSYLSVWWWHVILVLVYGMLPLGAVLVNNEKSFLLVSGVFIAGVLTEDALAAAFSLVLAVENVSIKVAAERISLERSQF